jgi:hypothetical protein
MKPEIANLSAPLAANQGFYNLLLSLGLLYGMWTDSVEVMQLFALFVTLAGIVGGFSVRMNILKVQAAPAFAAFMAFEFSSSRAFGVLGMLTAFVLMAAFAVAAHGIGQRERAIAEKTQGGMTKDK